MGGDELLEQARLIQRSFMALRKYVMARHVSGEHGSAAGCDLTLAQMNMVLLVRERGRATVKDLAEALRVSPPSVSSMVDRLVEMGVLTREQNQADRREVIIRTDPSAESGIETVERQALGAIVDVLQKLGPGNAKRWCAMQAKVLAALAAPVEPSAPVEPAVETPGAMGGSGDDEVIS